jgi:hypothetical protein
MAATKEELQSRIQRYQELKDNNRWSLLRSMEVQFIHMAQGGDGTAAMEGEIRKTYYPTWTVADFQTVCKALEWDYEGREQ